MYRFLLTPRWVGLCLLMLALAGAMVELGNWQLHRYQERSALNARIDAAGRAAPVPLDTIVPAPDGSAGTAGRAPSADTAWALATVTGHYDAAHELLARARTVNGLIGFEVITPLMLDTGAAVLVDRGWVPPPPGGATALPQVPAAPGGPVTVVGRVHPSESRPGPLDRQSGRIEVRRISIPQLAPTLPYPIYGSYLTMNTQDPPADPALVAIPTEHENAWQNAGYVVQWWMFAGLTIAGLIWIIRREARDATRLESEMRAMSTGGDLPQAPVSPAV